MKKWISPLIAVTLFSLNATQAWAVTGVTGVMNDLYCNNYWYVTVGGGASFYNVTGANNVNTGPGWPTDHYSPGNSNGGGVVTIGAGWAFKQTTVSSVPMISLGLAYTYGVSAQTNGVIKQYNLPQFENYNYHYDITRQTLLAVAKADLFNSQYAFGTSYLGCCQSIVPYVTAGAGVTWNKAGSFTEDALPNVTPRVSPGFHTNTNHYFAWMVGAGLDYTVQQNFIISLDYQYSQLGHARTGFGDNYSNLTGFNYSGERLKNKLTANTVLLSITGLMNFV